VAVTEQVLLAAPTTGRAPAALAAPWLFTGEDNLRLVIMNSQAGVTVTLGGRRMGPKDTSPQAFAYAATPTADRMPNTFNFSFGEGFLLNCSLIVTAGSPLVGQTYCMVQVIRGLTGSTLVLGCLLGGYVTAMQHLAYPGSPIVSSVEGGGYIRQIVGTRPAAGANLAETVPAGARWELLAFRVNFTCSGVAGNRSMTFTMTQGGQTFWSGPSDGVAAPSSTIPWVWAQGGQVIGTSNENVAQGSVPPDLWLLAGTVLGTHTTNLDVGDQFAAPDYVVRELLEAA
jgi:hypothetical protein